HRALARCTFIFVDPATVVQAHVAGEQGRIPVRIVIQHQQYLALEILAFEIIPAVLGRLDAVAHEDHFGILDRCLLALYTAAGDVLVPPFERSALAILAEAPLLWHLRLDADDVEGLLPAAIRTTWLKAD